MVSCGPPSQVIGLKEKKGSTVGFILVLFCRFYIGVIVDVLGLLLYIGCNIL